MKRVWSGAVAIGWLCLAALPGGARGGYSDLLKSVGAGGGGSSSGLSQSQMVDGLKEALTIGSEKAVERVSRPDGYYGNPKIRIPLPGAVEKVEPALRAAGFGSTVDEFELSMNRAAEKAAPEAKSLFLDAIQQMTLTDAQKILEGRKDEATRYFQKKTSDRLQALFQPIVRDSMDQVGATQSYQTLEKQIETIPFAGGVAFDLDEYVTEKSVDGLFKMLAREEAKIRTDPAAQVTDLLKTVFGN